MFCKRPLLARPSGMTFGHRRHPPIHTRLTAHHADHNRENNLDYNVWPVHKKCHTRYHVEVNNGTRQKQDVTDC
jgi:hypothetical protein